MERRAMQQRRHQLALHALAERELAHRLLEHVAQLEQGDQLGQPFPVISRRDVVDRAVQQERLLGRKVPHQLLPVTEHERDASLERGAAGPGHEPRRLDSPAGGVQEPREHLERRGLARAVRAQERDDLAGVDPERHVAHGVHVAIPRPEERPQGAAQSRIAHLHLERLAQPVGVNDRWHGCAGNLSRDTWRLAAAAAAGWPCLAGLHSRRRDDPTSVGRPPPRRRAAQHPGAPRPPPTRSLPRGTRRAPAERLAAAQPGAVRGRAGVRRRRESAAACAGAPRETSLAVYRIRRATAADAGVLARHRAEMLRDMGELPDGLYDTLVEAARAYVTQAITDGRYVGWVAELDAESGEIVGGAGLQR